MILCHKHLIEWPQYANCPECNEENRPDCVRWYIKLNESGEYEYGHLLLLVETT